MTNGTYQPAGILETLYGGVDMTHINDGGIECLKQGNSLQARFIETLVGDNSLKYIYLYYNLYILFINILNYLSPMEDCFCDINLRSDTGLQTISKNRIHNKRFEYETNFIFTASYLLISYSHISIRN